MQLCFYALWCADEFRLEDLDGNADASLVSMRSGALMSSDGTRNS